MTRRYPVTARANRLTRVSEHAVSRRHPVMQCCLAQNIHNNIPRFSHPLRFVYTMRTKCAISDAFTRDCVFA